MDNKLWMKHESVEQEDTKLSAVFPAGGWQFPLWSLDSKVKEDYHLFETCVTPGCFCSNSNPFCKDPFKDELATLLDGLDGFWDGLIIEDGMPKEEVGVFDNTAIEDKPKEEDMTHLQHDAEEESTVSSKRVREETRVLTYEEVSQYFYMPIVEAAKELNVGLTLLKKKCRELGIPRWPHRKIKSMQTLIKNVQELGHKEGFLVSSAIEILEQEQKLMEMTPSVEMQDGTRRLRQACFKANYKKRKLMAGKARVVDC